MKLYSLSGAKIGRSICLLLLSAGLIPALKAGPITTSPNYSVSVFATAPAGLSNPDSITEAHGSIFVAYANNTQPDGTGGDSTIVQFSLTGSVQHTYQVVGKSDGLKYNPFDGMLWAIRNEDANSALTLIDPLTGTQKNYKFAAPTLHGGGYDDAVFLNGQVFISASNPNLKNGQNIYPSIVKATLVGDQVVVSPVLMGNANLTDVTTGNSVVSPQSDPDSLKVDSSGNLVLDSQADGDLIFLNGPGFPNQVAYRLHLSNGSSTQVTVDDTVFPTAAAGTIYVVDTPANIIYAVTSSVFPPNSAFCASDTTGVLGRLDLQTGMLTPIVTGMVSPHGALFESSLPEVSLSQATSSGGSPGALKGTFRLSRSGDHAQALTVFLTVVDSAITDGASSSHLKSVVIPAGTTTLTFTLPLDSQSDFKEDGSSQHVLISVAPDPNYNVEPNSLRTAAEVLGLPLPQ
jgi:hypothetical protein